MTRAVLDYLAGRSAPANGMATDFVLLAEEDLSHGRRLTAYKNET